MTIHRSKTIAVICAAAAGICCTSIVFYPGMMSPDSLDHFRQATSGVFRDALQPPMMAFVWQYTHRVIPGPFGMLLLHNLAFWSGLALMTLACRTGPVGSVLCVVAVGFFPPVFALLGTIWKDVGMGAALTLAVGLILFGSTRESAGIIALAGVPLFYATCVRANALPAVVPLAVWAYVAVVRARGRPAPSGAMLAALGVVASLGLFALPRIADRAIVTSGDVSAPVSALQYSMIHDLAGIAVHTGELRMPAYVRRTRPEITIEGLRESYDPADANRLIYSTRWQPDTFYTTRRQEFDELLRCWVKAILAQPRAYGRHRADVLATLFQVRGVHYPFHEGIHPNEFGLEFRPGSLYLYVVGLLHRTQVIFFRGWMFAAVAAGIVVYCWRRQRLSAATVCASGLLYVVPYAVFSSGSDFRYIWWLVVATLIGVVMLRFESGSGEPSRTARA